MGERERDREMCVRGCDHRAQASWCSCAYPTTTNRRESHAICSMNSGESGDAVKSVKESENTHAMAVEEGEKE